MGKKIRKITFAALIIMLMLSSLQLAVQADIEDIDETPVAEPHLP